MPSKEQIHVHNNNNTTQDFLARDVDQLVAEIKENLRLRARPCVSKQTSNNNNKYGCHHQRPGPYKVPTTRTSPRRSKAKSPAKGDDSPYQVLQALLEQRSLIKEAVKRLQKREK